MGEAHFLCQIRKKLVFFMKCVFYKKTFVKKRIFQVRKKPKGLNVLCSVVPLNIGKRNV